MKPFPWFFSATPESESTTAQKQHGPMTNMWPAARLWGPPGRTGHSELGLLLGSPFITTCPSALSVPVGPLLHHGSTEDMFEQLTQGHKSRYSNRREPSGLAYQRPYIRHPRKIPVIYVSGSLFHSGWPFTGASSCCRVTILPGCFLNVRSVFTLCLRLYFLPYWP